MRSILQADAPGVRGSAAGRRRATAPRLRALATGRERGVITERRERLGRFHRLRSSLEIAEVKDEGRAFRGAHCLMLVLPRPGTPTRFGFIASRKGVGGAVQRNRARRRLREIVRRRWPRIPSSGYWVLVIAHQGALRAPHQELATDVERLLAAAGALAPIGESE